MQSPVSGPSCRKRQRSVSTLSSSSRAISLARFTAIPRSASSGAGASLIPSPNLWMFERLLWVRWTAAMMLAKALGLISGGQCGRQTIHIPTLRLEFRARTATKCASQFCFPQPQCVTDYRDRTQTHSRARDDRAQKNSEKGI